MQQQGWDCIGATMTLYRNEDIGRSSSRTCCSLDDVEDARSVAFRLRIPYYVFNFSDEFRCQVMGPLCGCLWTGADAQSLYRLQSLPEIPASL